MIVVRFLTYLFALTFLFPAKSPANPNLLRDPGFELTPSGPLQAWKGVIWAINGAYPGQAEVLQNAKAARNGKQLLLLESAERNMVIFDLRRYRHRPGHLYRLKVWAKGEGSLSIGFQCFDQAGAYLPPHPKRPQFGPTQSLDSSSSWQKIAFDFVPPSAAATLSFNFSSQGRVQVDDASLEEIALPAGSATPAPASEEPKTATLPERPLRQPEEDQLNGGFELWEKADLPNGWQADHSQLPQQWHLEARPHEGGRLKRLSHPPSTPGELGRHALWLDGRLVSDHRFEEVRGKTLHLSLQAKGEGANLKVRLREFTGEGQNAYIIHLMEMINTSTTGEWKTYQGEALVSARPGGPPISALSLELIANGLLIDDLRVHWSAPATDDPPFYQIPLTTQTSPTMDQTLWKRSAGGDFGWRNEGGILTGRQGSHRLIADEKYLYISVQEKFETDPIVRPRERDGALWDDDSVELHFNPTPDLVPPPVSYQFIFNTNGDLYDSKMEKGVRSPNDKQWNSEGVKVTSKLEDGLWTLEVAIPLKEVDLKPNLPFAFNLCRNFKAPNEYTNLSGSPYYDYAKMPRAEIGNRRPALFWSAPGVSKHGVRFLSATLSNHTAKEQKGELRIALDAPPYSRQKEETFSLAPDAQETVTFLPAPPSPSSGKLSLHLSSPSLPAQNRTASFDHQGVAKRGLTGSRLRHYPSIRTISVELDKAITPFVARAEFTALFNGKEILNQTESEIEHGLGTQQQIRTALPTDQPGLYTLQATLYDQKGNLLEVISRELNIKEEPLLTANPLKDAPAINAPYLPIQRDGKAWKLWGRSYSFNGTGLPATITSQGHAVLSAPVRLVTLTKDGTLRQGKAGSFKVLSRSDESLSFEGETRFDTFSVRIKGRLEYDGVLFYDLETSGGPISSLVLEIPFRQLDFLHTTAGYMADLWLSNAPAPGEYRDESVPLWTPDYRYLPGAIRSHHSLYFPEGDGLQWNSRHVNLPKYRDDYIPYLTFGNRQYGLGWVTENDRGWSKDGQTPSYEIVRKGETSTLSIRLITRTPQASGKRSISFSLAATPMRPKKVGFNEIDFQVIGFGESSFIPEFLGGLSLKDEFLFNRFLQKIDPAGEKPVFFYNAKAYSTLGNPLFTSFYDEWHVTPEVTYSARESFPTRKYGLEPDLYFATATHLSDQRLRAMVTQIDTLLENSPHLRGIYWDENYSVPSLDLFQPHGAHRQEDGGIQPGAPFFNLRELDKRVQAVLQKHQRPFPNLLVHSTALIPSLYGFADINLTSERGTKNLNFIEYWDLPRLENALSGAWGINLMWIPQWGQTTMQGGPNTLENNRSMLAALKLFDVNIWQIWCDSALLERFRQIEKTFGIAHPETLFFGYWQQENQLAIQGLPPHLKASFFVRPDRGVLLYLSNLKKKAESATITFDFNTWNLPQWELYDAETGEPLPSSDGALTLEIGAHDFRALEFKPVAIPASTE